MTRKFSTSISFMFRELPLLDRFAAAKAAGFEGAEIQVLGEGRTRDMAAAARAAGVEVVLINVDLGDYLDGGPGLSGVPGREATFRAAADQAFAAALRLDAKFVHLGPSRVPDGVERQRCVDTYVGNVQTILKTTKSAPFRLLLEPMNPVDAPTGLFTNIDVAADLLRDVFVSEVGLLFDLYHLTVAGADIAAAATRHNDLIDHVQFSDAPGRREPGTGKIDFLGAFSALEAAGYAGGYGAEYFPARPTPETLGWLPVFQGSRAS